jgi:hypothetical protein
MNGTTLKEGMQQANAGNSFPWAGRPDETACNLAFGNLVRSLPPRITANDKLHAPTLMAAAGAVAGVAAQISLMADQARLQKAIDEKAIGEVKIKDGRTFMYGTALNEMLMTMTDPDVARSRVWNMLCTAAIQKGLDYKELPAPKDMFTHVSTTLGTLKEGRPSTPDNAQPIASVRDLLKLVGPGSFGALAGEHQPGMTASVGKADRTVWVAITAQAAGNMLLQAAKIMPPKLGLTIAMESAIYASKLRGSRKAEGAVPQA